jgi:hypothetical protein
MFREINDPLRSRRGAERARPGAWATKYSSIVATLALFAALGGSAVAVTALPRDSVGAPQIRKDAVRSPEIAKDAVRSPEIAAGAVRSSELRDGGVQLADISSHAQHALTGVQGPAGVAEARVAANAAANLNCVGKSLPACPNLLSRTLAKGNWIVEAKLDVANFGPVAPADSCGLVEGSTVLDTAGVHLDAGGPEPDVETIALTGVLQNAPRSTTVGLRCAQAAGEAVTAKNMRITALQVTTITGP